MKNFVLIRVLGYISTRYMQTIKETVRSSLYLYDGIGLIHNTFSEEDLFTEFERFYRFMDKWIRSSGKNYISILYLNYLNENIGIHFYNILFGLFGDIRKNMSPLFSENLYNETI